MKPSFLTKLCTIAVIAAATATTQAQSLQFAVSKQYIENGSELYFLGTQNEMKKRLELYFLLTNKTNSEIMVEGSFNAIEQPEGTVPSLCIFESCLAANILPPSPLPANATEGLENTFYFEIGLNSRFEPATYLFNFNVVGKPTDSVSAKIHFIDRRYLPDDLPFETENIETDTIIFVSGGIAASNRRFVAEMPTVNTYPNPATDNITFELGEERGTIRIYSTTGNIVRNIQATSNTVNVNLTGLSAGIYFYEFETAGRKKSGKIVVK